MFQQRLTVLLLGGLSLAAMIFSLAGKKLKGSRESTVEDDDWDAMLGI